MGTKVTEIGVADFKVHISRLLKEVEETGISITVTSHGKPVADIVPSAQSRLAKRREASERLRKAREERPITVTEDELKAAREWGRK